MWTTGPRRLDMLMTIRCISTQTMMFFLTQGQYFHVTLSNNENVQREKVKSEQSDKAVLVS